jgi:D-lyxose ketol-isomerase
MTDKQALDRRTLLQAAGAAAGLAAAGVMARSGEAADECAKSNKPCIHFKNEQFYDAQGKFDIEKAKDAVLTLCKYHGYPIFPELRDGLWIADYNVGRYTEVGLAAYMFCNNVEDQYMLMDIFLLPGQMLPEHWHVAGEGNPAKREGWLVRWGLSHIVGIGEKNLGQEVVVPKMHMSGKVTTEHETVAKPGMFVKLAKVETRHWQYAGPEGAIITEVANVHTNSAVRHSDAVLNKNFLGQ